MVKGSGLAWWHTSEYAPSMARPLRIEFAGALYHVTSRGDRRDCVLLSGRVHDAHDPIAPGARQVRVRAVSGSVLV